MIVVDANLLIYAYDTASDRNSAAQAWLENNFAGTEPIRLPWSVIHTFLRLTTTNKVVRNPLSPSEAIDVVNDWLTYDSVEIVEPGPRYWPILQNILIAGQIRGPLVSDAHLAAVAIEHDAILCTADRDFGRFKGLRVINPIVS